MKEKDVLKNKIEFAKTEDQAPVLISGKSQVNVQNESQQKNDMNSILIGANKELAHIEEEQVDPAIKLMRQLDVLRKDTTTTDDLNRLRLCLEVYDDAKGSMKLEALRMLKEFAGIFLKEKKKDKLKDQETMCKKLIETIDAYDAKHDPARKIGEVRTLDYLFDENTKLSDAWIDSEIRLSYKKATGKNLKSVSKDRRAAFKRKLSDSKLARQIAADDRTEYYMDAFKKLDDAVVSVDASKDESFKKLVADYSKVCGFSTKHASFLYKGLAKDNEDSSDFLYNDIEARDNRKMILSAMLAEIDSWNIAEFSYKDNNDFFHRTPEGADPLTYYRKLKDKLSLVKSLKAVMDTTDIISADDPILGELKPKLSLLNDVAADYDNRFALMQSPYYATLLQEDIKGLSCRKISEMKDRHEGEYSKEFNSYLDAIYENKLRTGQKDKDLMYSHGKDMVKLYAKHRKKAGLNDKAPKAKSLDNEASNELFKYLEYQRNKAEDAVIFEKRKEQAKLLLYKEKAAAAAAAREEAIARRKWLKQREEDLFKLAKDYRERANGFIEKYEKQRELDERRFIANELKREKLQNLDRELGELTSEYGSLSEKKPGEDCDIAGLKEKFVQKVASISGLHEDEVAFIPINRLCEILLFAREKLTEDGLEDLVKAECKKDDSALLTIPVNTLLSKEKLTPMDEAVLSDNSMLLYKKNTGSKKSYAELKAAVKESGMDNKAFAGACVAYLEVKSLEGDSDDLEDKEQLIRTLGSNFLSIVSGSDQELFYDLKLSDITDGVNTIMNKLTEADKGVLIQGLVDKGKTVSERKKELTSVLEKKDKKSLVSTIAQFTGTEEKLIEKMPIIELFDICNNMLEFVGDEELLKKDFNETMEQLNILYGGTLLKKDFDKVKFNGIYSENYFEDRYFALRERIDNEIVNGAVSDPMIVSSRRQYGILAIGKVIADDSIDLSGLSDEILDKLFFDLRMIKAYKDSEDIYEQNDVKTAINRIEKMGLSAELIAKMEKGLEVKIQKTELKKEAAKTQFANAEFKPYEKKEDNSQKPLDEFANIKMNWINMSDKQKEEVWPKLTDEQQKILRSWGSLIQARNEKLAKKNKEIINQEAWSENAKKTLDIIGDCVSFRNAAELRAFFATGEGLKKLEQIYRSIDDFETYNEFNRLQDKEAAIVTAIGDALKTFGKSLKKAGESNEELKEKEKLEIKDIKYLLDNKHLDAAFGELFAAVEKAVTAGEADIIGQMRAATGETFDMLEGSAIPALLDDAIKETDAEKQREKDNQKLEWMQNSTRYDSNKGQGKFIQLLISGYYDNAPADQKRRMLGHIIRDLKRFNRGISEKQRGCDYFASALKGAGPLMQKMMQGVPERMVVPELQNAITTVKSDLGDIDPNYVNACLDKMKADSKGKILSIKKGKSLGAASVAQTFLCTITRSNGKSQEVVVKIMRPGVEKQARAELSFMRRAAMYADMTDDEIRQYEAALKSGKNPKHATQVTEAGFEAQLSEILKEFDFTNEVNNAKIGKEKYTDKERNISSAGIIEEFPVSKNYIVMEKAPGTTVDRFLSDTRKNAGSYLGMYENKDKKPGGKYVLTPSNIGEYLQVLKEMERSFNSCLENSDLVSNVAFKWISEALFGGGITIIKKGENFHHGDLHAGNIMIGKDKATVIDYGNAAVFDNTVVKCILNMMAATLAKSTKHFVEHFDKLLKLAAEKDTERIGYKPLDKAQKAAFEKELEEIFSLGNEKDSGKKIVVALTVAQKLNIKLPQEIQNFSQCEQRLENTMEEMKSTAIYVRECIEKLHSATLSKEDEDDPLDPLFKMVSESRKTKDNGLKVGMVNAAKKLKGMYDTKYYDPYQNYYSCKNDGDALSFLDKTVPAYRYLSDQKVFDRTKHTELIFDIRRTFSEVRKAHEKKEPISEELKTKVLSLSEQVEKDYVAKEFFGKITDKTAFLDGWKRVCKVDGGFDEVEFENLMCTLECRIDSIIDYGDAVRKQVGINAKINSAKNPAEKKKYEKESDEYSNIINSATDNAAIYTGLLKRAPIAQFRKRLFESASGPKREIFERQIARLFQRPNVKEAYEKFRQAQSDYKAVMENGTTEEFVKAKNALHAAECNFYRYYCAMAHMDFVMVEMNSGSGLQLDGTMGGLERFDSKNLISNDVLPTFVSVMGEVVMDNFKTSLLKIDTGLGLKIKAMKSEAEKKEAAKEKEEKEKAEKSKTKNNDNTKKKKKK